MLTRFFCSPFDFLAGNVLCAGVFLLLVTVCLYSACPDACCRDRLCAVHLILFYSHFIDFFHVCP
jgi:hypothetical protein